MVSSKKEIGNLKKISIFTKNFGMSAQKNGHHRSDARKIMVLRLNY